MRTLLLGCALAGLAIAGCGDAEGQDGPTVTQRVTTQFGRELLDAEDDVPLESNDTVLSLLRKYHTVDATDDGAVMAIDGRRPHVGGPNTQTWVLNVNGIEADELPSRYRLHDGDVVQWDLRDWYVTLDVRATVGAFPETFTRGVFGKRFPVTVECQEPKGTPCIDVIEAFERAGVATDGSQPPGGPPPRGLPQRAKVLVAPWWHLRTMEWPRRIDRGPRYSGVFARFAPDAKSVRLLDWNGHYVRDLDPGTGMVAAMRPTEEDLLWIVTGVDHDGLARAARTLDRDTLRDTFAIVVTDELVEQLPLPWLE